MMASTKPDRNPQTSLLRLAVATNGIVVAPRAEIVATVMNGASRVNHASKEQRPKNAPHDSGDKSGDRIGESVADGGWYGFDKTAGVN